MYSVYAGDLCIYNDISPLQSLKMISPVISLEDNSAGSFSFTLSKDNAGYDKIEAMVTDIVVKEGETEIFAGRVISEEMDFWKNKNFYCEGEYAFLNDSIQPQAEYHDMTVKGFLEKLIEIHNSKVQANRRFTVGNVTVTDSNDSVYRYTNFETTMECVNTKLIDKLGGHIRIRKSGGVRYIDYLADYADKNSQTIEFGKNLLDFTESTEHSEYATVILPLGSRLEESPIEELEAYTTVESVNGGSLFVQSDEAVAAYGRIEKVVHWDDVSDPSVLLEKAKKYLSDLQFDNITIKVSAIDLHGIDRQGFERIGLLDQVRVVSKPYGMDRYFPVNQMEIHLDAPEESKLILGATANTTLTSFSQNQNGEILEKLDDVPKMSALIEEIKERANEIMNAATTGYITIVQGNNGAEALYCTNTPNYRDATQMWRLNINGFGYSEDGQNWDIALTRDGQINADMITAGIMNANIIRAGILQDVNSNVSFDLENGTLTMKKGSINLGNGAFSVNTEGSLTSVKGKIGGFTIEQDRLIGDGVILSNSKITLVHTTSLGAHTEIGQLIGVSAPTNETHYGMVMSIMPDMSFMGWGASTSGGGIDPLMIYFNKSITTGDMQGQANTLYIARDTNFKGKKAYNVWIDPNTGGASGGITGTLNFVQIRGVDSAGKPTAWSTGAQMVFKNGLLIDASWNGLS